MLGRVDQRLAGRPHRGPRAASSTGGVADDDQLDGQRVVVLDLGDHAGRQPGQRATLAADRGVVQPGAQLALLAAGEPGDRRWLVGVPLDQRQRLQHRVVQVGGDRGPLLGADARRALLGPRVEQPAPERRGHQDDADEDHQGGGEAVARVGQLTRGGQQQHDADGGEHDAPGERPADAGHGEGAVGVQLPPDHGQTRRDQDQRQHERCRCSAHSWPTAADAAMPSTAEDDQLTPAGAGRRARAVPAAAPRRAAATGMVSHSSP